MRSTNPLSTALLLALSASTLAHDVVRRQVSTVTEGILTIQTDTVLGNEAPFMNTTYITTRSTTASDAGPTTDSGDAGAGGAGGTATSIALSTYTIPLSGGGYTTSTEYAVPSETGGGAAPTLQDGGAGAGKEVKGAGVLGAVVLAVLNMV